jgi:ABC-type sugar transport system ATPase subunit
VATVELEGVEKSYPNGVQALRDCTLGVDDGELLVLVGPSGCGKSTLLRLVAGLESVTRGTLRIGGQVVNELPAQERNVAMVFQDYALYPHMTVRRNLEFPLRMRRAPRADRERSVERAARMLEITHLLERRPREMSGGQRQRVAMGRALVREPSVFLLDEPLSNLDARLRVQVRAEIKEVQRRTGTTMLYVTHDQVEAMTLGDRVAVLDRGQLRQVAPPAQLYAEPADAFVAGFIGNPPMNLLPGRLARAAGRTRLRIGGRTLELPPERGSGLPEGESAVTVGVRPEDLGIASSPRDGLEAKVEHVEYLGHETLAHLRLCGEVDAPRLVARLPAMRSFAVGQALALGVEPAALHLFDLEGRALGKGPSSDRA